jgi:hypothetical protein
MELGRKFWFSVLCVLGVVISEALVTWLWVRSAPALAMPPAYLIEFYAGGVMALLGTCGFYNGGNVGATFAHQWTGAAKREDTTTSTETTTRQIIDRRTGDMEPTE